METKKRTSRGSKKKTHSDSKITSSDSKVQTLIQFRWVKGSSDLIKTNWRWNFLFLRNPNKLLGKSGVCGRKNWSGVWNQTLSWMLGPCAMNSPERRWTTCTVHACSDRAYLEDGEKECCWFLKVLTGGKALRLLRLNSCRLRSHSTVV